MVQCLALLSTREVSGSSISLEIGQPDLGFSWFSSVPAGKCWYMATHSFCNSTLRKLTVGKPLLDGLRIKSTGLNREKDCEYGQSAKWRLEAESRSADQEFLHHLRARSFIGGYKNSPTGPIQTEIIGPSYFQFTRKHICKCYWWKRIANLERGKPSSRLYVLLQRV